MRIERKTGGLRFISAPALRMLSIWTLCGGISAINTWHQLAVVFAPSYPTRRSRRTETQDMVARFYIQRENEMFDLIKAKKLTLTKESDKLITWLIGISPKIYLKGVETELEAERLRRERNDTTDVIDRVSRLEGLLEKDRVLSIAAKASEDLKDHVDLDRVDLDWREAFLANAARITSKQMQDVWARLLAFEINDPGSFSIQTVNIVANIGRRDAQLFANLCRFAWTLGRNYREPIVFSMQESANLSEFANLALTHAAFVNLESLGLISIDDHSIRLSEGEEVLTYADCTKVRFKAVKYQPMLPLGLVAFTRAGRELASIVDAPPIPELVSYCVRRWVQRSNGEYEVTMG